MYIVSYDITVDKLRNKIAKTLLNYGRRVQYSVFECDITKEQYRELYQKLAQLMTEDVMGSIRFYYICENCAKKIVVLGIPAKEILNEDVLVI